ncbi:MAG TPA: hypothetical protein VJQ51_02360, partial [Burkholderiales bacterium]|nr:hypothetical protein [Burkholderiales bacterium]
QLLILDDVHGVVTEKRVIECLYIGTNCRQGANERQRMRRNLPPTEMAGGQVHPVYWLVYQVTPGGTGAPGFAAQFSLIVRHGRAAARLPA